MTLLSGGTEKIRVLKISTDGKTQKEFTCSESEIAVRPRRNSRKFGLSDSSKCDDSHNRLVGIDMDSSSDNRDRKSELLNISLTNDLLDFCSSSRSCTWGGYIDGQGSLHRNFAWNVLQGICLSRILNQGRHVATRRSSWISASLTMHSWDLEIR